MSDSALQFLFHCYFNSEGNPRERFIRRAYYDMNRTLHGISMLDEQASKAHYSKAAKLLEARLNALADMTVSSHEDAARKAFDQWHSNSCNKLMELYNKALEEKIGLHMFYGQAQKWLNMVIKYNWVCGTDETWKLNDLWYRHAHIAVDNIILKAAKGEQCEGLPSTKLAWSRWDFDTYIAFQTAVREETRKQNTIPLSLEFEWWLGNVKSPLEVT